MARKRHSDEDVLKLLREIEVHVHSGMDVTSAIAYDKLAEMLVSC